jgi:hypothetical protein
MALKSGLWIMEVGWMGWMDDPLVGLDESFRTFIMEDCQKLLMQYHGWPLLCGSVRRRVGTFYYPR